MIEAIFCSETNLGVGDPTAKTPNFADSARKSSHPRELGHPTAHYPLDNV
jgi:hypothetical protein